MQDCYFWIDEKIPEAERGMNVLCVSCHDKNHPKLGWFWEGSRLGYGPYDFVCGECGFVIHPCPIPENTIQKVAE